MKVKLNDAGRPVSSGEDSRLEPARFGSYRKPMGVVGGASVSTVLIACGLPASEDVTAVTNLLFDTPSFFGQALKCEVAHTSSSPMAVLGVPASRPIIMAT